MAERNLDSEPSAPAASYELQEPTLATARTALEGFFGAHTDDLWLTLLFDAGLTGEETGTKALHRLIAVMQVGHPIARLCARSLAVRVAVYDRLVATGRKGDDA
ncbi:hypothetical protein [Actinoplanes sp. DH11]|uniref:hypothetical protein n=1 Tax=Actinoplanes sp. DH11 TaxID=2857011 RepID=UPI001E521E8D|nr:hypothetical protein [Actinoplanes sp. DH11]